jgi:hypothetical protein
MKVAYMNKKILLAAVAVGVLALSGCGGDEPAANPNFVQISAPSFSPASPSVTAPIGYFSEVPNAISVPLVFLNKGQSSITTVAADLNGDNLKDLVMHLWTNAYDKHGETGSLPSPNKLLIYVQNQDGTFSDRTNQILPNSNYDLGGASRKVKVSDLNNDGKPDFFYAINQEDGRSFSDAHAANAQLAALVSTGSTYKIIKFGKSSWHHSVGFGVDMSGKQFVSGNGYTNTYDNTHAFNFDSNGTAIKSSHTLPDISATSFEFLKTKDNLSHTDLLIQPKDSEEDYLSVRAFILTASNVWSSIAPITLAEKAGTVLAIGYDGGSQGVSPVFRVGTKILAFAGLSEMCKIRIYPSQNQVAIVKMGGAVVPNFQSGMTIRQNDLQPISFLRGVKVDNGALIDFDLNITGEVTENVNSNFFDCNDINNDGYDDIVVYSYNENGLPHVYINTKDGRFSAVDPKKFPSPLLNWGNSASSIYTDFNNDGIPDLMIFPANGINGGGNVSYKFYKGTRLIQ